VCDWKGEAIEGGLRASSFKPGGVLVWECDKDDVVRRERAKRVLDRFHRVGVGIAWRSRGLLGRLAARFCGNAVHAPWREVGSITSVVTLKRPCAKLRLNAGDERWATLVGRVPGS
jgi:trehalose utilization protein